MATSYSPKIVTDGMVLCVDAADKNSYLGSGTAINNLASTANTGSFKENTSFSTDQKGAFNFDGTDDYIEIDPPIPQATTEITINAWFKATGPSGTNNDTAGGFIFGGNPGMSHGPILTYSWANEQVLFSIYINQGFSYATGVSQNTIHNACGTFNRPTGKVYINGVKEVEDTKDYDATYENSTDGNRIGMWGTVAGYPRNFQGQIYLVQVYNRELSADEVLQNYNAQRSRFGV